VSVIAASAFTLAVAADSARGSQPVGGRMQLAPPEGKVADGPTPVTFGVVFRPGEIGKGKAVKARLAGAEVPVQLDAKRHYEDGSLKHGVVSVVVPKLDRMAALEFSPAEPSPDSPVAVDELAHRLLAGDFEAIVSFKLPDGDGIVARRASYPSFAFTTEPIQ
jgi:hypothetical protein